MPLPAVLLCLVVGVTDGDTLTARCLMPSGSENVRVRLAEVDAPENAQAFGKRSRQHLAGVCLRKRAVVRPRSIDQFGRTVGRVECEGVDAATEQLRAGMAWVFDDYVVDRRLYSVEAEARNPGRGLWADRNAIAPWRWRRAAHADSPEQLRQEPRSGTR
ncbi:MAG: thermonuclease family protein [Burkholderiaceae bacterium]